MNDKVILTCTECLSRNYTTTRNKKTHTERLELNKYCKKCGKYIIGRREICDACREEMKNGGVVKNDVATFHGTGRKRSSTSATTTSRLPPRGSMSMTIIECSTLNSTKAI